MDKKIINKEIVAKLEASKKEALKRIAENMANQAEKQSIGAAHSSHSSGFGKGHTSYVC